MKSKSQLLLGASILTAGLILAGCSYQDGTDLGLLPYSPPTYAPTPGFGNAVAQNQAAHIIDPEPAEVGVPPDFDGRRAALAISRYQRGQVIRPRTVETTDID